MRRDLILGEFGFGGNLRLAPPHRGDDNIIRLNCLIGQLDLRAIHRLFDHGVAFRSFAVSDSRRENQR
ncbi:MAG: hypothetical protein P0Y59_12245 [Candidatus Sphingomonas phytovorans]|nr:hypothetical protein [Sphingomonas sp.]WEK02413.1 MAG: hypothetical protein P0Y59_12245 [Sphingomonas sp.]